MKLYLIFVVFLASCKNSNLLKYKYVYCSQNMTNNCKVLATFEEERNCEKWKLISGSTMNWLELESDFQNLVKVDMQGLHKTDFRCEVNE